MILPRHLLRAVLVGAVLSLAAALTAAETETKKAYDLAPGDAATTLKQFSAISGRETLFAAEAVRGVKTPPVKGTLTAQEAMDALLADTGLIAVPDAKTGAYSIRRETPEESKNGASRPVDDRTAKNVGGAIKLDDFKITESKVDGLNNRSIFSATEEAALPYNVIGRAEIDRLGATSMEELFRYVPEATNYGNVLQSAVGNPQVSGGQTYSTAAINLRGFGTTQTIVLINGRRLGQGSNVGGPDISRIPVGAIERIEILPAAAAAIYGGGAIGGAVNIVLRREYSGSDVTTYLGTSTQGGGTEFRITYMDGRTFNGGRTKITTTLDFSSREPVYMHQRDFLQKALAKYGPDTPYRTAAGVSLFETIGLRALAGMPGIIVATNSTGGLGVPGNTAARIVTIPFGLNNAQANALTPASFANTIGVTNPELRYNRSVLYRPQENYSFQAQIEHEIFPDGRLSLYAEANAAYQRQNYSFPQYLQINLSATDPFNPFRTGVTPGFVGVPITILLDTPDITDPSSFQERNDARVTIGLKGKINPRWEWTLDASGQYQRLYSEGYNPQNYLPTYLTRPGPTDPGSATVVRAPTSLADRYARWNPFVDHDVYRLSQADEMYMFYYNRQNSHYNRNGQVAMRVVGDLVDLPAGALRVSPGAEIRFDETRGAQFIPYGQGVTDLLGIAPFVGSFTPASNTNKAAYLETRVPVLSRKMRYVPIDSFEIGFSRRWDQFNHTRNTISSTVSGDLRIVPDLMLRASLTEGFNPIDRAYITPPVTQTNFLTNVIDPMRGGVSTPTTIPTYVTGGNPSLRTEFARSKNFGFVLKPRIVRGLTLNVNYFVTKRFDTSAAPALTDLFNFPGDYAGRVERAALTPADQAAGYTGGAITRLDLTRINLASVELEGFDYRINYALPVNRATVGTVNWSVNVTNYNSYRQKTRPSSVAINFVDVQNNPLRWRGNSSLFWEKDRWLAGVTATYVNSYYASTTQPTPATPTATGIDGRKIKHSLLFDVQVGYKVPAGAFDGAGWKRVLNATEFRLGILNALDRDPPFYTDSTGFYSRYNDPRQRFVYLQVRKSL